MSQSILMSPRFWQQTGLRALRTFSQSAISVLGGSAVDVWSADWKQACGVGLGAAAMSVLMSLDRLQELPADNPEDAAIDAMLQQQGIAASSPLPEPRKAGAPAQAVPSVPPPAAPPPRPTYVPTSAAPSPKPAAPYGGLPTAQ
jgi:hypothetical protein